jgi:hypothetical protein
MNCDDVGRLLSQEAPSSLPAPALEHLSGCARCQKFARAMDAPLAGDSPTPGQLREIEKLLVADLRAVRPVTLARYFLSAAAIFACAVAAGAGWLGVAGFRAMTPLQATWMFIALGVSAVLLAYSLVQQMAPGSRPRIPPLPLPLLVVMALVLLVSLLFHFQREINFWDGAWDCIRVGVPLAALTAVPLWFILRRGAILSPVLVGAAAGLLAGLAAASALEIRCPNLNAWHILAAHIGVAGLGAVAGAAIGLFTDR